MLLYDLILDNVYYNMIEGSLEVKLPTIWTEKQRCKQHSTTLHYTTLHPTTLHYITFHYTNTLCYTTLHSLQPSLQLQLQLYTSQIHFNNTQLPSTTLHSATLHYIRRHAAALPYTTPTTTTTTTTTLLHATLH